MHNSIENVLFSGKEIENIVNTLAKNIEKYYNCKEFTCVGLLKGCFIFMADLVRKINLDFEIDFMTVSSYRDSVSSSGDVKVISDVRKDVAGKNLLIVDDVTDTGNTLEFVKNYFIDRGAQSVKFCTLFDKPQRRVKNIEPDFCGAQIPDEFIVGYGLDYKGKYRNLPYLGILNRSVYENK